MKKHLVINLGIDNLFIGFFFKTQLIPYLVSTYHSRNWEDPCGLGLEFSNFNNLLGWLEFHPSRVTKTLNMFMIENKKSKNKNKILKVAL
jgi:hypothetical protein